MKTYIKKDVVEHIHRQIGGDIKEIAKIVDETFYAIRDLMSQKKIELRIEIRNFGVFEVKKTKAKPKARNPKTNVVIYVPPRRKTHFKPGKLLQEALKEPI
ncbi:integration host factor subunit beta [bacterium]|nr:integration host factor subunit beta [bacterium]